MQRILVAGWCVAGLWLALITEGSAQYFRPGECGPGYQKENYGCVPIRGGRVARPAYPGPRSSEYYRPGECGPGFQKENYGCVPIPGAWGGPRYEGPQYRGPRSSEYYRPGECGPGYQKENYGCVPIRRCPPGYGRHESGGCYPEWR